ncbi:hypothetical protein BOTBODRAFT_171915 [Botryobasidium botryosum FD-172 SS1]|uniref:tRNA (guanine(37)-N1)-methyltransferase n=1 Tax=Botryobasidium botryosum (strain FD-172 SS1) TaxID=930990 RepID=A0A067N292_BOTB1|nr:hypothetical protein BOTBODRAFT_171915 [Botryobasidium botryosum FD-172 SS1]
MSSTATIDTSPPTNRGMRGALNRDAFRKSIPLLAVRVPAAQTTKFMKSDIVKSRVLDIPKVRTVIPDAQDSKSRLVLLRDKDEESLSPEIRSFIEKEALGFAPYNLELDYSYWTADEILQAVLPEHLCETSPTSFTITGHLAHINLKDEYLPYKYVIGQVILDKHKGLRTVVNKLDNIDTEFRFFKMEVIAGESDFVVEAHEANCKFTFDFSSVYWNSRLHTEHERLVSLFNPGDVIADVFAGVGPFAIPAAKKGCVVFGNDLNPSSAKYMQKNADDNQVNDRVRVSNVDGREYIRQIASEAWHRPFPPLGLPKSSKQRAREKRNQQQAKIDGPATAPDDLLPSRRRIDHFVMNLPGTALEFLDSFRGILAPFKALPDFKTIYDTMPMVHCHCFTKEIETADAITDIRRRAERALGHALPEETTFHFVRAVAPKKDMYCVSFALPRDLALGGK